MNPNKLLWIDMEMTGLDPSKHRIVEVAALVTDWDFNELASLEVIVGQTPASLSAADPVARHMHETSGLWHRIGEGLPEKLAEEQVCELVKAHFGDEPALLAGNSIHQDRQFIRRWWPELEKLLHYRMLDVSAWKVVMNNKYKIEYPKDKAHRALDDIQQSINELRFYLDKTKL